MDEKIPEPLGAAHTDPMGAFPAIRKAILDNFRRWELGEFLGLAELCLPGVGGHALALWNSGFEFHLVCCY